MDQGIARSRLPSIVVSFSGIDGAGKSTQIENLRACLAQTGRNVRRLAFWDDVAVLTRHRDIASHNLFGSERGIGAPEAPVNRRDKNVQSWFMTPIRLAMYCLDALSLAIVSSRARRSGADVVIFDRYLYDELANLRLSNPLVRVYAKALLKLAPTPDIAYFLDADPDQARARKPEYPVEFLRQNRSRYLELAAIAGMAIVSSGTENAVGNRVMEHFRQLWAATKAKPLPAQPVPASGIKEAKSQAS